MNRKRMWYCRLCWQSFDTWPEHNAGSFYGTERLNGHCPGDIRLIPHTVSTAGGQQQQSPKFDFDAAGEPLVLGW